MERIWHNCKTCPMVPLKELQGNTAEVGESARRQLGVNNSGIYGRVTKGKKHCWKKAIRSLVGWHKPWRQHMEEDLLLRWDQKWTFCPKCKTLCGGKRCTMIATHQFLCETWMWQHYAVRFFNRSKTSGQSWRWMELNTGQSWIRTY